MTTSPEHKSVRELRDFLKFLQHLWAALAGISVLFPLSNTLFKVIPLAEWDEGGFVFVGTNLVSALATVACLFAILWMFAQRGEFRARASWESLPRRAVRSFVWGVLVLILYLTGYVLVVNNIHTVFGLESADTPRVIGDLLLLLAYCGFFVLLTRAFLLLGLREYLAPEMPEGPSEDESV